MRSFLTFVALSFVAEATTVSPVQKVIELMDELKAKVQGDLKREEGLMAEYANWCDEEKNEKEGAITSGKRTMGDRAATIEDTSGRIAALTTEVEELAGKISASEADLAKATDLRRKENGDFSATEKELTETIDTMDRAIIVLKRGQSSFLQSSHKDLSHLASALSKIVEATWVNSHQKSVVQSLIQSGDGDEDLSFQPQASVAAFSSQGSGILDTFSDMKSKAESTLSDARKAEMESSHEFQMLKQSLDQEIKHMKGRLAEASGERSSTEEAKHLAEAELQKTKETVAADSAYLEELNLSCAEKANDWATRQKSAGDELAAVEKAKEILADGVASFMQTKQKAVSVYADARREEASKILRSLAKKDNKYALAQLASAVESDPFVKVRGMVEAMITRLMEEAAAEADANAFCTTEMSKSKAKQADLTAQSDMHAVRIEKGEASKAQLNEAIKTLEAEIAEIDAGQAEATSLRQKEHEAYVAASTEYKQSAEAVANAIEVLQNYYSQGAFVQVSTKQAPELGGAKSDISGTIISILENAEGDFTRLLSEAEAAESAATSEYEKLSQDNKATRTAKVNEAKGKRGEVKSVEVALLNYKEDHASTSKELDAVLLYVDKLKPQCETKVMSYAERVSRREAEIAGLKEALTILGA